MKHIFYATKHLSTLQGMVMICYIWMLTLFEYDEIVDPTNHKPFESVAIDGDKLAILMYTSGTTGLPKGVMFSYDSLVNNLINTVLTYKINATYKTIIATPMFHVLGFNDLILPLLMAGERQYCNVTLMVKI